MKRVRIIKRVLSLLLIFLLSINSFAAIVSDNDGSAFITKAEFDALKSSFQSQIDTYNQSIDSKIDGAIASYLSGIKLSTEESVSTILPADGKIKMIKDANEVAYKKGLMKDNGIVCMNFRGYSNQTQTFRNYMWVNELTFKLKTSTNLEDFKFNKIYISNIDDSKKIGDFFGFYEGEHEELKVFQYGKGSQPVGSTTDANVGKYGVFKGEDSLYKTTRKTYDGSAGWFKGLTVELYKDNLSYGTGVMQPITFCVAFFNRVVGKKTVGTLLIPKSIPYTRFTDYDRQAFNFSNDDELNSKANTMWDVYDEAILEHFQQRAYNDYTHGTVSLSLHDSVKDDKNFYPPYEGFANTTLINWNQIYNSAFDVVASTYSSGVTTDSKGVKHLMSYAGLPIALLKKDQSLEYELKFEDTTKEYDVWVKLSPFGDKEQDSESGLETKISAKRGNTTINLGANKYLTVKSGDTLVVDNAEKEGYVFIKWREKDDTSYGGGTLISTGEARIIKQG